MSSMRADNGYNILPIFIFFLFLNLGLKLLTFENNHLKMEKMIKIKRF